MHFSSTIWFDVIAIHVWGTPKGFITTHRSVSEKLICKVYFLTPIKIHLIIRLNNAGQANTVCMSTTRS